MFEVPWYYYAISAIGIIITIILGFLKYCQSTKAKKSPLKIEVNKKIEMYQTSPNLKIIARNRRQTNMILEGASIFYQSSFFNFKNLPYTINKVYFSPTSAAAYRNFPYPLQAESSCMVLEPYDFIAHTLQQNGLSGKVKIKIVFRDATGKKHPSEKFIFDTSESKHPSNPISGSIL